MTNFKQLAMKYLRASKGRCVFTIFGVMISVMVLYGGLNLAYSFVLDRQAEERKTADWEVVCLTDDMDVLSQITADDRVKRAYIGTYAVMDYVTEQETVYDTALYIVTKHPYRMDKIRQEIAEDYGVQTELNEDLATYYLQDSDMSMFLVLLLVLLISYIFAIFAVGVIRNAIQMFTLEQVKDYGILRCIGATKGQLGSLIYRMGAVLELTGIAGGTILGTIGSMLMGWKWNMSAGFHIVPLLPVLIAYLGDLVFVMWENCKKVSKISPVAAVKGVERVKKEKIQKRGWGLMGRLFGIEGAYARKNVLRNRGRFVTTTAAMTFSVAAIAITFGLWQIANSAIDSIDRLYGDYQVAMADYPSPWTSIDEVESYLPSSDELRHIASDPCVIEAKKVYQCQTCITDWERYAGKVNEAYAKQAYMDDRINAYEQAATETGEEASSDLAFNDAMLSDTCVTGYDEQDLQMAAAYLKDGTTELSDHGILVTVGGSAVYFPDEEVTTLYDLTKHFDMYDVKVGDEIRMVNFQEFTERCQTLFDLLYGEAETEEDTSGTENAVADDAGESECIIYDGEVYPRNDRIKGLWVILTRVRDQMMEEGKYRTYVVEGILDYGDQLVDDVTGGRNIYMKLSDYLEFTGYSENQISGMKYKIDSEIATADFFIYNGWDYGNAFYGSSISDTQTTSNLFEIRDNARYAIVIVIFLFLLSSVNIINTTMSGLHLRRKEFAQLRVIGMSRKRLIKTVMLEGLMTVTVSNVLGIVIGAGLAIWASYYISMVLIVNRSISWTAFLPGVLLTSLVIIGSNYLAIRGLPEQIVDDLKIEE